MKFLKKYALEIICFIFIIILLLFLVTSTKFTLVFRGGEWKETSCDIKSVEPVNFKFSFSKLLRITFSYNFNEKDYECVDYSADVSRYKEGKTLLCFVNPHNPSEAVIEMPYMFRIYLLLGIIACLIAVCLVGIYTKIFEKELMKKACEKTIIRCDRNLKKNPSDVTSLLQKGSALDYLERYKEAVLCYDKILTIIPDKSEVWLFKGGSLMALERYGEAIICYNKVLEFDPDYGEAENFRKRALAALREQSKEED